MWSLSRFDFIEIAGAVLVAFGCLGELWLIFRRDPPEDDKDATKYFKKIERFWGRIFVSMVAIGVTTELICLPKSLHATAALEDQTAQLVSTNLLLSLKVEELREQNNALEFSLRPRMNRFDAAEFAKALKGKPVMRLELLYPPNDAEAYGLAFMISMMASEAGWEVLPIRPFTEDDISPMQGKTQFPGYTPLAVKVMGLAWQGGGAALIIKKHPADSPIPPESIKSASSAMLWALMMGKVAGSSFEDDRMPTNLAKIVIGPKIR